jgi:hypothetical protein
VVRRRPGLGEEPPEPVDHRVLVAGPDQVVDARQVHEAGLGEPVGQAAALADRDDQVAGPVQDQGGDAHCG